MIKEHLQPLQFVHPMTQKSLNLVKELEKYWKCLMISMCLAMVFPAEHSKGSS
jgi:hypothetical protein